MGKGYLKNLLEHRWTMRKPTLRRGWEKVYGTQREQCREKAVYRSLDRKSVV